MEPDHASIGQNILIIDKYMKMFLRTALKPYNLNTAEGMALLVLYEHDGKTQDEILNAIHQNVIGVTQEQIIDELHYDKGAMTRVMQALETKGFVKRQDNETDGRSYIFFLTDTAKDFKPTLISVLRRWSNGILCGFDEQEVHAVERILRQLSLNAVNMVKGDSV